mgnify:CR=1 FL=1
MVRSTIASFKGDDAKVLVQILNFLSKISPYAKIMKGGGTDITIYAVARSELAAALIRLLYAADGDSVLDGLFKVAMLPALLKRIIPVEVTITGEGLTITALHKSTRGEVRLELGWLDIDYPPPPPLKASYDCIIDMSKEELCNAFDLFALSCLDDVEFIVDREGLYLRGIGTGITLSINLRNELSLGMRDSITICIPSVYAKLMRLASTLLEDTRIYFGRKAPLIVSGRLPLELPSIFYLIISSRASSSGRH